VTILLEPLPFKEAIESFRDKVVLPPEKFKELTDEAKSRAFSIAGLTRQDLLADAFAEVERGLSEGISFGEFKRNLGDLFERKGWTGLAPWRAENIFRTNIQTAYQVGRYRQMTDPYVLKRRPYWMYDAVNDGRTRPTHAAMDGKVYPADSPVWDEWHPPNGYRCRCSLISLGNSELAEMGLKPEESGPLYRPDPGWDFNPAKAAWGDRVAAARLGGFGQDTWKPLLAKTWKDFEGRPKEIPYESMPARLGKTFKNYLGEGLSRDEAKEALRSAYYEALGGRATTLRDPLNEPFEAGARLGEYLLQDKRLDGREAYLPLLPDVVQNPYEVWLSPEIGEKSGRVVFRKRYVKGYQDNKRRHMVVVADSCGTFGEGWNMVYSDTANYARNQRRGWLLYGR